ncbi:MAG: HAD-IIIC family phosphatase, partial [Verrucomicrobiota bacterium]
MSNDSTTIPLEIAATFTAEPLERPLNHWFDQLGFNVATRFAPYNQVFQTLLDPNSPLRTNNSGLNVLLIRPEDWQRFGQTGSDEWRSELQRNATEFIEALQKITPTNPSRLLLILTPASPDTTSHPDSAKLLAEISQLIFSASQALGLTCLTPETLQQFYPVSDLHDPVADHEGHLPYSDEFFTALATAIARRLHANLLPPRKVIVLDADNTLWPGVAAEIGPENLEVTPPFQAFQKLLKTRRESGLLLALASKNEETDVHAAFQKATGMVLTEDDIVAWKVNWSPKSENITTLAGELNLGLDSFLFIDDNPVEIAQVNAALPSVLTLQIPSDPDQIPTFLDHLWLLDLSSKTTKEDRERTAMYQTMVARNQSRSQTSDFKTFLEQLELQVEFLPPSADIIPRLAQLSQRTNQFNTTTLRRSEDDFKQLILDDSQIIALKVSDRFGDYGLVGLVTAKATDTTLNIDSLLLSCRVLGKGVEQQLLAHLAELAQDLQIDSIDIDFIENERNTPAQNFLERIGKPHRTKTGFLLPVRVVQAAQKLEIIEETQVASPFTVVSSSLVAPAIYQAIATASSPAQILAHIRATAQPRPDLPETYAAPANETEKRIATLWQNILGIDRIGRHDKFSALGGKSLQVIQLLSALTCEFDAKLSAAELFENNTITAQAKLLNGSISSQPAPQNQESKDVPQDRPNSEPERGLQSAPEPKQKEREAPASHPINQNSSQDLAVVGMSCRLPESPNVHQFWQNLLDGKECLSQLTDEELLSAGVEPSSVRNDPSYLPVKGIMPDVENFDAAFFGIIPKEAKYMDPQQRVFLELTWECIEDAGYNPETYPGKIGLWAGNYLDTYVIANLVTDREFLKNWIPSIQVGSLQAELGNDKDYLTTRVAFKLNLRGPAMTVQTACSTSLVAISQAAQALRSGSCDMAMAGGVTITLPEKKGYYYTPDGMLSGDGSCRAFDEKASGTVFSNGAGIVLLKRLEDAQRDGDHIHAVIKGYALNNDGGTKHSYTAPSIDGQAGVITDAIKDANIDPSTISYVEAHGTGTPLGDPIEVAGLTKAYRALGVTHNQGCTLGTVKTNVGHLDVASGVTALIKTSFALEHGVIPPTLHFQNPNPKIDFENSPFQVRNELHQWNPDGHPRRAGISSFGVGGTNAHVILEEPPKVESSSSPRPFHLFPLSARSPEALTNAHQNLASYCADRALNPADVSHTLRIGRKHFNQRQILVSGDLANLQDAATVKGSPKQTDAPLVFMFPGQGSQTVGMGKDLYASEPVFRAELDRCSEILLPHLGEDLRHTLFPPADADQEAAATRIKQTIMAQPAIFVLSYCQAKLLIHWGLQPTALVGHSVGELVAATISGVVTLEDALEILANRGRLMQEVEPGGMLSVRLSEKELTPLIPEKLDLAAVNGPNLCVVAGPHDELEAFTKNLAEKNIAAKPLHTSHGFHSWMMNGVIEPFQKVIANAQLSAPQIPIRSTVTTEWLTDEQATDPHYWASHVRKTVRFTEAAAHFTETPETTLLEVGPGQTLSTLSRQVSQKGAKQAIFSSSGHATDTDSDALHFHLALGQLWLHGHTINWSAYDQDETRKRTPLPTYPFERKRFWIEPKPLDDISSSRVGNNADQATSPPQPTPQISQPTPQPEPTVTTPVSTDRKPAIQAELCNVLEELSGIEPEEMLADASLIELGFDSLMLTQVSKEIEKFFGVATTMRQLLGTLPTIGDIINHLDAEMPADKFAETASPQPDPAPPTATPVAQPLQAAPAMPAMPQIGAPPMVPGDQNSLMAQMMAMQMQQMQFMQQQMAAMAGIPQPAAPTPAAPPTPPAP